MGLSEGENQLGNKLVRSSDAVYDEKRSIWNTAIDKKPAAIVVCETEEDVVAAVKLAKENQWSISVRSGGHHVGGFAVCDNGLMIDISNMNKVTVDIERKIVEVETGAKSGELNAETQKYGLAVPLGTASGTGVAGVALSGGIGYLRGMYGLTCDNIIGATIVTAEGELLEVNEENYPDLFWAIRGGGGNFGVVTKLQFTAHEIGTEVLALDVMYDYKDAKQILQKVQAFIEQAPDEAIGVNLTVAVLPPTPFLPEFLHFKKVIMLLAVYGGDAQEGEAIVQPLRELAEPLVDQSGVMPFLQIQQRLDPMIPERVNCYGTSLYFADLNDEAIDALLENLSNPPAPSILGQLWALGGQMNRVPANATPFAVRDAKYVLLVDAMAMGGDDEACKQWVDGLYENLLPLSHKKASYLNALDESEDATKNAFQENLSRLVEVKKKYDPTNTFRHNHNIDPNV